MCSINLQVRYRLDWLVLVWLMRLHSHGMQEDPWWRNHFLQQDRTRNGRRKQLLWSNIFAVSPESLPIATEAAEIPQDSKHSCTSLVSQSRTCLFRWSSHISRSRNKHAQLTTKTLVLKTPSPLLSHLPPPASTSNSTIAVETFKNIDCELSVCLKLQPGVARWRCLKTSSFFALRCTQEKRCHGRLRCS